ncbi:phorbol-12-myristate-13-acetate-induced protein 1 isoform X1 [Coturnix japonica]|uniref:phorbol-12-myristate-13-acetate-induced protein 1 isoform X1 n=1 Tax=Coturnix japonica TaxID=93934 RepID=UPI0013A5C3BF|nr:phorbol-12-myristate-13-acetate-induced protein 1 isoform X1 [Coturnix japonica]
MMPGRTIRKPAPPAEPADLARIKSPPPCACLAERDAVAECAVELRRIGDKADLRQKILNLITKLFCPKT